MSAFPFAAELSAGPAIQVIRNCARDHGLRAAVVVLMQLSGIEPTAEAVGSHSGALAGRGR